jgi:hypothetical protein
MIKINVVLNAIESVLFGEGLCGYLTWISVTGGHRPGESVLTNASLSASCPHRMQADGQGFHRATFITKSQHMNPALRCRLNSVHPFAGALPLEVTSGDAARLS